MNINPRTWFPGLKGASDPVRSSALVRAQTAMGPWQSSLGSFVPREVNPWFLEALRESLGILDGAVNRLVTIDGIIDVEGGDDALVQLIQRELISQIPVGDFNGGLQAFYAGMGQEQYEQGFGLGEMVFDRRHREVVGLRVADSKGVLFHRDPDTSVMETWYLPPVAKTAGRRDGTDSVQNVLRNSVQPLTRASIQGYGYAALNADSLIYSVFNPENDMPYGVSLFRGIEFVSQILLRMHNATSQVWDRFGDPMFHVGYKTKNRGLKDAALELRRKEIAKAFAGTLDAKRSGNSADFVTAVGSDDDIEINIIGGDGKALTIEMPAQQMFEQILAKTGLASWVLGVQLARAPAGLADTQAEIMLQDSKTRFESRRPALERLIATWLRGRGQTWKHGDWKVVQRLPNLRDQMKQAQAGFLEAQTQLMLSNAGTVPTSPRPPIIGQPAADAVPTPGKSAYDIAAGMFEDPVVRAALLGMVQKHAGHTHGKGAGGESWAIDDPNLPRIQTAAVAAMQAAWQTLADQTLKVLAIPATKAPGEAFAFDATSHLQQLLALQEQFITASANPDAAMVQLAYDIWVRGIENTAEALDREAEAAKVVADARQLHATASQAELRAAVQKTTVRVYENDIVQALTDGIYNGTNPRQVAAALRKKFDGHDYDWQRLAESEMAAAHAQGNLAALGGMGFAQYDWLLAPEACAVCTTIEAAGPYAVGAGPMPVRDSHPGCFCVIAGHVDQD